jgi:hypothetical protein
LPLKKPNRDSESTTCSKRGAKNTPKGLRYLPCICTREVRPIRRVPKNPSKFDPPNTSKTAGTKRAIGWRVFTGDSMKRAVLYLRVSTLDQTTANQERELREVASRMGCEIVQVYKDHGISGAKGRDKRPQFDRLCRDAAQRKFDLVMAWSVDRLGRSLQDLVSFLSELHALRIDLFLHQQWVLLDEKLQATTHHSLGENSR